MKLRLYAKISLPLRIPSINSMLYGDGRSHLRRWCYTARGIVEGYAKQFTVTNNPVVIRITAEYQEVKYAADPDNILCSPLINSLKGHIIRQDGFAEVSEVRKRSRCTGRDWCTIEVFEEVE